MAVPLLDLKAQFAALKHEIMPRIEAVLDSQVCIGGPEVERFEKECAAYCGTRDAIAISSGTDAILAALMAMGIKPGDEVILPSFTFFATAGCVHRLGAKPVFADIEHDTFNIDPADIERKITAKTKVVMPVHLFGQMADMDPILDLAEKYGLKVLEDACQSIGSAQRGVKAGALGLCGAFSFFPSKNLGGAGDGGLITTNDQAFADHVRLLRNHGAKQRYFHDEVGANFRLDAIQCAYLSVKLRHLDSWHAARQKNAAIYQEMLGNCDGIQLPRILPENTSIYNQYTMRVKAGKRDALLKFLGEKQIGAAVYYPLCLHQQDCFAYLGGKEGDLPVSEQAAKEVLSIPIFPELAEAQVREVASAILEFFK